MGYFPPADLVEWLKLKDLGLLESENLEGWEDDL
jgi:hypothetical protein